MSTPMFITELAKIWNQPKCLSMDEWIKKLWCVGLPWWHSG